MLGQSLILFLATILGVLLGVAFYTVTERQIMGSAQRRQGPALVGFSGTLQAVADGVKLIAKESIFPSSSDLLIFIVAPVFSFAFALLLWLVIPFSYGFSLIQFTYPILLIFTISSLAVHSVIFAGWSSNSKYSFLGALRSAAQMISYEISLGLCIVCVVFFGSSFNIMQIILMQKLVFFGIPMFALFLIFFVVCLAETNRHPFDLPEAESELVSGFNTEYAAAGFALFFLAEYSNIIVMSFLNGALFWGGWLIGLALFFALFYILIISFKTYFFTLLFVLVRAAFPRVRYDNLMRLGWKVFLPLTLFLFFFYLNIL